MPRFQFLGNPKWVEKETSQTGLKASFGHFRIKEEKFPNFTPNLGI